MTSPLSVKKNNYFENPKRSDIYTPTWLSEWLYELVANSGMPHQVVFDPAIGAGSLTNPFRRNGSFIIGCDINCDSNEYCDVFLCAQFEALHDSWNNPMNKALVKPDLIIVNPPFNSASGRKLYPEVFLRKIEELFTSKIPVIMIAPMGLLLNQRRKSKRWRYLRDNWDITSVIALPIDVFDGVLFHAEIVCFNTTGLKPFYFMPESILPTG